MDILSILALGKANKALKNGGGGSGGSDLFHIYEFSVTGSSGNYTVTTDVDYQDIISDINNGIIPIAHIEISSVAGFYAMLDSYSDGEFTFAPHITVDSSFGVTSEQLQHYHMDGIITWNYLERNYYYIQE